MSRNYYLSSPTIIALRDLEDGEGWFIRNRHRNAAQEVLSVVDDLENKIEQGKREYAKLQEKLKDITSLSNALDNLKIELACREGQLEQKQGEFQEADKMIQAVVDENDKLKATLNEMQQRLEESNRRGDEITRVATELEAERAKAEQLEQQYNEEQAAHAETKEFLEAVNERLVDGTDKQEIASLKERLSKIYATASIMYKEIVYVADVAQEKEDTEAEAGTVKVETFYPAQAERNPFEQG